MTYSDQVRAEVAARYGVPVRCKVQIIPQGVIAADTDPWATDGAVRRGRLLTAKERQQMAELRDGGASFREIGRYLNRSYSHVYSVLG
ncbi:helix-turn-helix domain-containing protein [Pseudogemmobacter bohemicus]|uniref:helix-turn-helix domain-containing protein n=1 Tax=Pseudogemmobacter bohemicus TaxID=2250708 RepID=UPI000DD48639|nr:helix-turn-helix domain-containing protein [Pseudogemmobacter bohemicus]